MVSSHPFLRWATPDDTVTARRKEVEHGAQSWPRMPPGVLTRPSRPSRAVSSHSTSCLRFHGSYFSRSKAIFSLHWALQTVSFLCVLLMSSPWQKEKHPPASQKTLCRTVSSILFLCLRTEPSDLPASAGSAVPPPLPSFLPVPVSFASILGSSELGVSAGFHADPVRIPARPSAQLSLGQADRRGQPGCTCLSKCPLPR